MIVFRYLNQLLYQTSGKIQRSFWRDRMGDIILNKKSLGEFFEFYNLTVYGNESERDLVLSSMNLINQRNAYLFKLIKRMNFAVFFDDDNIYHNSTCLDDVIFFERDSLKHEAEFRITSTLIYKSIKTKCSNLGIPKTRVSARSINHLFKKIWMKSMS